MARATTRILAILALIAMSGITTQASAEQAERREFQPPGQVIDIGRGEQIHLRTWGTANHRPTIVLDVSAATPSSLWAWVGPALGEHQRVVAFDRPGMAWSRGPWAPRDSQHAADALASYYRVRAWLGHAGIFQLSPPDDFFWELPASERPAANAVNLRASHLDTSAEELEAWPTSAAQVRTFGSDFGDLPVLVVSGVGSPSHIELQRDLANISSASRFVEINADHMGMLVSQPQSQLVVQVIEDFLAAL